MREEKKYRRGFFRQTFGLSGFQSWSPKKLKTSGFTYMQTGENFNQLPISGWNLGVDLKKEFSLDSVKSKKVEFALGREILSDSKNGEEKDRSFLPQYGTNHLFNVFMDAVFPDLLHIFKVMEGARPD